VPTAADIAWPLELHAARDHTTSNSSSEQACGADLDPLDIAQWVLAKIFK